MARLTPGDVACWVLKTATDPRELSPGWRAGEERLLDRCVRPSYRLDLLTPGQPCLLWLSGRQRPGVHALGTVADHVDEGPGGPSVAVRVRLLDEPVPRAELLADPAFAGAEVVRMAAGSNPSWLSAGQFAAVLARVGGARLGPWRA
ncbi:hypothetical protein [Blastococcus sp. SYSU DS0619]